MKGEVKIRIARPEIKLSFCLSHTLCVCFGSVSGSVSQSLALTLTLILALARTLAEAAAPALALTLVLLLTGLSFWHWL